MDPLSEVLSLLKPKSYRSGGFEIAADSAIQWPVHPGIKCYAVVSGQCWLSLNALSGAVHLTAGDCFLLPRGRQFCLAADLSIAPVDFFVARVGWERPGHPWTLQPLAERAGMSRSIFAQRFKQKVGSTPMEYLLRWRMLLAGERLKNSTESVSTIASSLGYESESAFGKAFRRVMDCSPRQHSRRSDAPMPSGNMPEGRGNEQTVHV